MVFLLQISVGEHKHRKGGKFRQVYSKLKGKSRDKDRDKGNLSLGTSSGNFLLLALLDFVCVRVSVLLYRVG